jgi:hypothetical protein
MLLNNGGLWVLPDGEVYAAGGQYDGSGHQLLRFDGDAWRDVPLPDTRGVTRVTSMRLAPDGSVWALLVSRGFPEEAPQDFEDWWYEERPDEHLARLDGESWTMLYSTDAGVPTIIPRYPSPEPVWEIHPNGTIWALADPDPSDRDQRLSLWSFDGGTWQLRLDEADWLDIGPDGTVWVARSSGEDILSFDGSVWRRYPGLPALALWPGSPDGFDTAPDGTAWVLSGDEDALYVITPEAVAGTE